MTDMTDVATKNWYIVHTYSGFEKKVAESLQQRVQAYGLQSEIGEILMIAQAEMHPVRPPLGRALGCRRTAAVPGNPAPRPASKAHDPLGPCFLEDMMIRTFALFAASASLAFAAPALAQAPSDPQIAHIAYTAGQIDVEAARQALQRSHDAEVRAFAETMVREVERQLGPVDILINNAGITRDTTFHKMSALQWQEVINTNLNSVFNMTRPVIDGMRNRKWGRIVQISSINGQKGQYGQANYAAAKAGMHGFTKSLALESARKGVTVNTISPGYIGTKMVTAIPENVLQGKILPQIPVSRLGKPEEIAGLIIYLCSEEAAFVTGANIAINGGQHMQ